MAPRAFWTGHLRLSLVNIPVKLYPATTSERAIALHQIHEPSGTRIRYQKAVSYTHLTLPTILLV